ncbi:MAG TPA: putative baseplate assembly protein [Pyrinomonadaceae bacterium]|jgi:predicted phage baseplate assembly protein|nr:putative baseplate assembly protein [Pyrinomonadaceae bacterium]
MPLPIPNLDDKTFNELFDEARGLIPRYAPEWTDHNLSDPGITLIDLFAWLAEMQLYFLDRVTEKNFLKFLRLLGGTPLPARPAAAHVTFEFSKPDSPPVTVPKGFQVAASDPVSAERVIFETVEDVVIHSGVVRRVLTRAGGQWFDNTASNAAVGVSYFAFGDEPERGDQLYFGLDASRALPEGKIKLVVNVFDTDLPPAGAGAQPDSTSGLVPSAELEWHYRGGVGWKELKVEDGTAALSRSGSLGFAAPDDIAPTRLQDMAKGFRNAPAEDPPLYWLRASVKEPGYEIPPGLDTVALNTVAATHGKTIEGVQDEHAAADGLPFQQVKLRHRPVLHGTVELKVKEEDEAKSVGGQETWHEWTEVEDFDASGPDDRHFTVNLKDGLIKFGDGVRGRIPPAVEDDEGNIHVVRYRVGGGVKGNVGARAIKEILPNETLAPGLKETLKVNNPRPSAGGAEAEPLGEAKSRARRSLKEVTRGVTTGDFETLTLNAPGLRVARVKVLTQYHPKFPAIQMPGAVTVVVVPQTLPGSEGKLPVPSGGFLKSVEKHLKAKSLVATNLSVVGPKFVEVTVAASVRVDPRAGAETVRTRVIDELRRFLNPLTGGHDGAGWPFGRPVYKTEIYQLIDGVEGVVCVEGISLSGESCDEARTDRITLRKIGLVYSGEHRIAVC